MNPESPVKKLYDKIQILRKAKIQKQNEYKKLQKEVVKYYLAGNSIRKCVIHFKKDHITLGNILRDSNNPTVLDRFRSRKTDKYEPFNPEVERTKILTESEMEAEMNFIIYN